MSEEKVKNKGGRPGLYAESKAKISLALTPSTLHRLDELASQFKISRSEVVERATRGLVCLAEKESLEKAS